MLLYADRITASARSRRFAVVAAAMAGFIVRYEPVQVAVMTT